MKPASSLRNEKRRLEVLWHYEVLDTPPEAVFDDLVALAAYICEAPIALISFIDEHRQWFKSRVGLTATETARDISFCGHAIHEPGLFIVPDAALDKRFSDNPLVTAEPHIRFYAGAPLIAPDGHALGTLCVIDRVPRELRPEQLQALRVLSRHVMTQLELRRRMIELAQVHAERDRLLETERTLSESKRKIQEQFDELDQLYKSSPAGLCLIDGDFRFLRINERLAAIDGRSVTDHIGRTLREMVPEFAPEIEPIYRQVFETGEPVLNFEVHGSTSVEPAIERHWLASYYPLKSADGMVRAVACTVQEITERKQVEKELCRLNRALHAIIDCNQAMVRARDETELLATVCRIVVETGGYLMVWVGYAETDEARTVRPVAQVGFEQGYLQTVNITWADTERGRGPIGTAIRTGQTCPIQNIHGDPRFEPWRREASRRGYASVCGLPMTTGGRTFGALGIYASEPNAFDTEEVALLRELANDLAYGIAALRSETQRKEAEEALQKSSAPARPPGASSSQ